MNITIRQSWSAVVLVLVVISAAADVDAAGPQLSASSISATNGEPWLLYGVGLDEPALKVHVATLAAGKEWDPVESLKRLLEGKASLPEKPPQGTATVGVYAADAHTAAVKPFSNRWQPPAKMVWAETSQGISPPLVVNRPEVWAITPPHLVPGIRARVFGPNMGSHIGLVGPDKRVTLCRWSYGFSLEKGLSPAFERTFEVPAGLPAGSYQLFVNGGGGDSGWSRPRPIEVTVLANPTSNTIPVDAIGDGQTPCAAAIQKAIDAAAAAGGGTILLKPGQYRLEAAVRIKPGVTLRGSGTGATTLLPPRQGKIPATFHHYRPLVQMHEQAGLEYVSVDASEADDHHALLLLKASDSAIRHCRIVNLNPAVFPAGKWVAADVVCTAVGHTRNLLILDNEFRGTMPFTHWGGTMTGAWVAHNRFEGLPSQNSNFGMRGMRECVFEHNRVLHSGRGIVVAGEAVHNYFGYNRIENIRDLRLQDRAGILVLSERAGDATPPATKTFGNEIRTCQVYHRERYPGNEYGLGERVWRYPINSQPSGNARHVKFGQEAGIHLSQLLGWPGSVSDDDAKLDQMPPTMRWNLIYDCLVARSPIGIRVGRGIDHTVIVEPFSAYNARPISDAGRQTVIATPTVQPVSQGESSKAVEGVNTR